MSYKELSINVFWDCKPPVLKRLQALAKMDTKFEKLSLVKNQFEEKCELTVQQNVKLRHQISEIQSQRVNVEQELKLGKDNREKFANQMNIKIAATGQKINKVESNLSLLNNEISENTQVIFDKWVPT